MCYCIDKQKLKHHTKEAFFIPAVGCCSNTLIKNTEDAFIYEIMFTYCRQERCSMCPLANISTRSAKLLTLKDSCQNVLKEAQENGFKTIYILLAGGDSFSQWELLKQFSSWLWEQNFGLNLILMPTLCETILTQDMKIWILHNKEKLRIIFRWSVTNGERLWSEMKFLRHPSIFAVDWCLTKEKLSHMKEELKSLLRNGKQVRIEYLDLESWTGENISAYIHQITMVCIWYFKTYNRIWLPAYGGGHMSEKCKNVIMTDVDGRSYPCRYLSPERMIYSALRGIQKEQIFDETCAAESYFCKKSYNQRLLRRIHTDIMEQCLKS